MRGTGANPTSRAGQALLHFPQRLLPAGLRGWGRTAVWRRARLRQAGAACLVGIAVWLVVRAYLPQPQPSGRLLVTVVDDRPAGHRLTAADLQLRPVPDEVAPQAAVSDPAAATDRVLAAPVSAGEVLTAVRLHPAAQLLGLSSDTRALHLPLADPAAVTLLRAGDRIDIITIESGKCVAQNILILAVDQPPPGSTAISTSTNNDARGIVVAALPEEVVALTQAAFSDTPGRGVHVAIRSPSLR